MKTLADLPQKDLPKELRGLSGLAAEAGLHWKEHLPNLYARLRAKGELKERLQAQADSALEEIMSAGEAVLRDPQVERRQRPALVEAARRRALRRWIHLPGEKDDPMMRGAE